MAEATLAFWLGKPAGFVFQSGQNVRLSLGEDGESRTFTIASAPHEPELMLVTRLRESAFKSRLRKLEPDAALAIDGPDGMMTLHREAARPAVFIAGGIGITPFLSMLRDAVHRKLAHRITLFYSNRTPRQAAFLDELQALQSRHPGFRLVTSLTHAGGERLGEALLRRHLDDVAAPVYYLAGPPRLAVELQAALFAMGVGEEAIRSEEFYGY